MVEVLVVGKGFRILGIRYPAALAQIAQRSSKKTQLLPHPLVVSRGWSAGQPGDVRACDGTCRNRPQLSIAADCRGYQIVDGILSQRMSLAKFTSHSQGMGAFGPADGVAERPQRRVVEVGGLAAGNGNRVEALQPNDNWVAVNGWEE